jgi:coproporphyrinogen III oxidase-like Fe-S oxidoreductase
MTAARPGSEPEPELGGGPPFADWPPDTLYAYPVPVLTGTDARSAAAAARLRDDGGATAVYIHVPFCVFICRFCDFVRTDDISVAARKAAFEGTRREIATVLGRLGLRGLPVDAVYFGGGTASLLSLKEISLLLDDLHACLAVAPDAELTFEGECLTLRRRGYLDGLRALGFQRLSFGVQTLDEGARSVLNLRPTAEQLRTLAEDAAERFADVNADFIYGWPGQSVGHAEHDLGRMVDLLPVKSVELFRFERSDAAPDLVRAFSAAGLDDGGTAHLQRQLRGLERLLAERGFRPLGFTKHSSVDAAGEGRYSACYYGWDRGQVLGFGRGAQSFFGGAMWGSSLAPREHADAVAAGHLPVNAFAAYAPDERESVTWPRRGCLRLPPAADRELRRKLTRLADAGYCERSGDDVVLTAAGRAWVPSIMDYLVPAEMHAWRARIAQARLAPRSAA